LRSFEKVRSYSEDVFMTAPVFGPQYADQYDLLYKDKDYEAECDLLEKVFQRYAKGSVKTILDLGCGTGSHAIPLAVRGYQVTGVDLSADMLAHAQGKGQTGLDLAIANRLTFAQGDVRSVDLGQQFDAVLMMFAVLGYQLTNEDVLASLSIVRRHLKPNGIFICDVWYGPAVLAVRPSDRVKVIPTPDGQIIRAASGTLDTYRHLCEVRYQLWRMRGNVVVSETEESHQMRYFFPQELAFFLSQTQLKMVDIRSFDDIKCPPSENTWNVLVIGKFL
jgi:SAM-dependent methyltransferase